MASCEMHGCCQVHDRLVRCLKIVARQNFFEMYSDAENVESPMKLPNL